MGCAIGQGDAGSAFFAVFQRDFSVLGEQGDASINHLEVEQTDAERFFVADLDVGSMGAEGLNEGAVSAVIQVFWIADHFHNGGSVEFTSPVGGVDVAQHEGELLGISAFFQFIQHSS